MRIEGLTFINFLRLYFCLRDGYVSNVYGIKHIVKFNWI